MKLSQCVVGSYFDGWRLHEDGPFTITLRAGVVESIRQGEWPRPDSTPRRARLLIPGLVEAHAHLFLDGDEMAPERRAAHLNAPRARMLEVGRRSMELSRAAGVTLLRDAGDIHGINLELRAVASANPDRFPRVLSAGRAIRKSAGYGRFMALELADDAQLEACIAELALQADQIKILLTGIIDFDAGTVKGEPQFTLQQAARIVRVAKAHGLRTFAHCSGVVGIDIALDAGIDSIEHGYFVTREQLARMADQQVNWVPTLAPVHFAWSRPDVSRCGAPTLASLERILDCHRERIAEAFRIGVPVLVGSDAGSLGVGHGSGLLRELALMAGCGVSPAHLLHSATSAPRARWGQPAADIEVGGRPDLVLLDQSPLDFVMAPRTPLAVLPAPPVRDMSPPLHGGQSNPKGDFHE